jgi:mannitol/fructose-specific phosphotransferase system IIA component (Ntr-type)
MLNQDFDPLKILDALNENQITLNDNLHKHARAIEQIIQRVNEQQRVIDTLVAGLDAANKSNEIMLAALVDDIHKTLKEAKHD